MHSNSALIEKFYNAFKNLDAEGMKQCYHPEVQFSDPVFPTLSGETVSAMWAMLISSLKKSDNPWRLEFDSIEVSEDQGSCRWQAYYTISATGRKVHNIIKAKFKFKDGLIINHQDSFNFYHWARQGFGVVGTLIGWTQFFKGRVQSKVSHQLKAFTSKQV